MVTFEGEGLPVWQWKFLEAGKTVAFHQQTVDGGNGMHYELHDVATGRPLVEWSPEIDQYGHALPKQSPPKWVTELMGPRFSGVRLPHTGLHQTAAGLMMSGRG